MTLGKVLLTACTLSIIYSCSNNCNEESIGLGDYGFHLSYRHVPTDTLQALGNDYSPNVIDTACADLRIRVMSSLKDAVGYKTPQHYYLNGVKTIEREITSFLDPKGDKYNGMMPIPVSYTTEGCKSINIILYNKDDNYISNITEDARFYYVNDPYDRSEDGCNIIISADRILVGKIEPGTTIKEYLSFHPMVFAEAHFIFPNLKKDTFTEGNYVIIDIELINGRKLTTCSTNRSRF